MIQPRRAPGRPPIVQPAMMPNSPPATTRISLKPTMANHELRETWIRRTLTWFSRGPVWRESNSFSSPSLASNRIDQHENRNGIET